MKLRGKRLVDAIAHSRKAQLIALEKAAEEIEDFMADPSDTGSCGSREDEEEEVDDLEEGKEATVSLLPHRVQDVFGHCDNADNSDDGTADLSATTKKLLEGEVVKECNFNKFGGWLGKKRQVRTFKLHSTPIISYWNGHKFKGIIKFNSKSGASVVETHKNQMTINALKYESDKVKEKSFVLEDLDKDEKRVGLWIDLINDKVKHIK